MDALGSWLLNKYIGDYVELLDSHNFKFKANTALLTNLRLKKSVLDELDLPVTVVHGTVGSLELHIPDLFDLGEQPVVATVKNLNLLAKLTKVSSEDTQAELMEKIRRTKRKLLDIASLFSPQIPTDKEEGPKLPSFLNSLATKIVFNLELRVENVHIRVEDSLEPEREGRQPLSFAAGVTIGSIQLATTDKDWNPTFVQIGSVSRKFAQIGDVGVYLNVDCPSAAPLFTKDEEALNKALSSLIPAHKEPTSHQFVLHPFSAAAKVAINLDRLKNPNIPLVFVDSSVQQIKLSFGAKQSQCVLRLVSWSNRFLRRREFASLLYFRPKERPSKGNALEWWKYAHRCIQSLHEQKTASWKPDNVTRRIRDKALYRALYTKILLGKTLNAVNQAKLTQLEDFYPVDQLLHFRNLAAGSLTVAERMQRDENEKKDFFDRIFAKTKNAKSISAEERLASERAVFELINFNEESPAEEVDPTSVLNQFSVSVESLSLNILGKERDPLMFVSLTGLSLEGMLRENWNTFAFNMASIEAVDHYSRLNDSFAIISTPQSSKGDYLKLSLDLNPIPQEGDVPVNARVSLVSHELELVFSHTLFGHIGNSFMLNDDDPMKREIEEAYDKGINEIAEEAKSQLKYALLERVAIDLSCDLRAPLISIPRRPSDVDSPAIVLDLGRLHASSDLKNRSLLSESAEDVDVEYFYDRFNLTLSEFRGAIVPSLRNLSKEDIKDIECDVHASLSVLVAKTGDLIPLKVKGTIERLFYEFTPEKLSTMILIINDVAPPPPQFEAASKQHTREGFASSKLTSILPAHPKKDPSLPRQLMEFDFSIKHLICSLRQDFKSVKSTLVVFHLNDIESVTRVSNYSAKVSLHVRSLVGRDGNAHPDALTIVESVAKGFQLISISFEIFSPDSDMFANLDSSITMTFGHLQIRFIRPVVSRIIHLISSLDKDAFSPPVNRLVTGSTIISDAERVMTEVRIELQSLTVYLTKDDVDFMSLEMSDASFDVKARRDETTFVKGNLVNLCLAALNDANEWTKLIYVEEGSHILDMSVDTFVPGSKLDTLMNITTGHAHIRYEHRMIMELVKFITQFVEMDALMKLSSSPLDDLIRVDRLPKIGFVVQVANPYIIIPQNSSDSNSNTFLIDLGHITVSNSIRMAGEMLIDNVKIVLKDTNMKSCVGEHEMYFIAKTSLNLDLSLTVRNTEHLLPETSISVGCPDFTLLATNEGLTLIFQIFKENLIELPVRDDRTELSKFSKSLHLERSPPGVPDAPQGHTPLLSMVFRITRLSIVSHVGPPSLAKQMKRHRHPRNKELLSYQVNDLVFKFNSFHDTQTSIELTLGSLLLTSLLGSRGSSIVLSVGQSSKPPSYAGISSARQAVVPSESPTQRRLHDDGRDVSIRFSSETSPAGDSVLTLRIYSPVIHLNPTVIHPVLAHVVPIVFDAVQASEAISRAYSAGSSGQAVHLPTTQVIVDLTHPRLVCFAELGETASSSTVFLVDLKSLKVNFASFGTGATNLSLSCMSLNFFTGSYHHDQDSFQHLVQLLRPTDLVISNVVSTRLDVGTGVTLSVELELSVVDLRSLIEIVLSWKPLYEHILDDSNPLFPPSPQVPGDALSVKSVPKVELDLNLTSFSFSLLDDSSDLLRRSLPIARVRCQKLHIEVCTSEKMTKVRLDPKFLAAQSYNLRYETWEPILEPWAFSVVYEFHEGKGDAPDIQLLVIDSPAGRALNLTLTSSFINTLKPTSLHIAALTEVFSELLGSDEVNEVTESVYIWNLPTDPFVNAATTTSSQSSGLSSSDPNPLMQDIHYGDTVLQKSTDSLNRQVFPVVLANDTGGIVTYTVHSELFQAQDPELILDPGESHPSLPDIKKASDSRNTSKGTQLRRSAAISRPQLQSEGADYHPLLRIALDASAEISFICGDTSEEMERIPLNQPGTYSSGGFICVVEASGASRFVRLRSNYCIENRLSDPLRVSLSPRLASAVSSGSQRIIGSQDDYSLPSSLADQVLFTLAVRPSDDVPWIDWKHNQIFLSSFDDDVTFTSSTVVSPSAGSELDASGGSEELGDELSDDDSLLATSTAAPGIPVPVWCVSSYVKQTILRGDTYDTTLVFCPRFVIQNALATSVLLTNPDGSTQTLRRGEKVDLLRVFSPASASTSSSASSSHVTISLKLPGFAQSAPIVIDRFELPPIALFDENNSQNQPLTLSIVPTPINDGYTRLLTIQMKYWLISHTLFPLEYAISKGSGVEKGKHSSDSIVPLAGQGLSTIGEESLPISYASSFPLRIRGVAQSSQPPFEWSEEILCVESLPFTLRSHLSQYSFSLNLSPGSGMFAGTTVIHIRPAYVLANHTNRLLVLRHQQDHEFAIVVPPRSLLPLQFPIGWKETFEIGFTDDHLPPGALMTLKDAAGNLTFPPYLEELVSLLKKLTPSQQSMLRVVHTEMTPISWSSSLCVDDFKKSATIYLQSLPLQISHSLNRSEHLVVSLAQDLSHAPPKAVKRNVVISIGLAGFSLVDRDSKELVYVTVERFLFKHVPHLDEGIEAFQCSVHHLQIDNQLHDTPFPVVFCPVDKGTEDFFQISGVRFFEPNRAGGGQHWCEVSVHIRPMEVAIDEMFFSALLGFVTDLKNDVLLLDHLHEKDLIAGQFSKESLPIESTVSPLWLIDDIRISEIKFYVSFSTMRNARTQQKGNNLKLFLKEQVLFAGVDASQIVDIITTVQRAPLSVSAVGPVTLEQRPEDFLSVMGRYYANQWNMSWITHLLAKSEVSGILSMTSNIGLGITAFFKEPITGGKTSGVVGFGKGVVRGTKKLFSGTVGGVFDGVSKLSNQLGGGAAYVAFDPDYKLQREKARRVDERPQHVGQGLFNGLKGLASGVYGGVTGVVMQPIKRAKEHGAAGVLPGLGIGLVGIVAKPVAGAFDFLSQASEGISNTGRYITRGGDIALVRRRLPRAMSLHGVSVFSLESATGQQILWDLKDGLYSDETYIYHEIFSSHQTLLVSSHHLFVLSLVNSKVNLISLSRRILRNHTFSNGTLELLTYDQAYVPSTLIVKTANPSPILQHLRHLMTLDSDSHSTSPSMVDSTAASSSASLSLSPSLSPSLSVPTSLSPVKSRRRLVSPALSGSQSVSPVSNRIQNSRLYSKLPDQELKYGYLILLASGEKSEERYFAIFNRDSLSLYEDMENGTQPSHVISSLNPILGTVAGYSDFAFAVVTRTQTFHLQAPSYKLKKEWVFLFLMRGGRLLEDFSFLQKRSTLSLSSSSDQVVLVSSQSEDLVEASSKQMGAVQPKRQQISVVSHRVGKKCRLEFITLDSSHVEIRKGSLRFEATLSGDIFAVPFSSAVPIAPAAVFTIFKTSPSKIALRSSFGTYVTVSNGRLLCNAMSISQNEVFRKLYPNRLVSIRTRSGDHLSHSHDRVFLKVGEVTGHENWFLTKSKVSHYSLQTRAGKFLSCTASAVQDRKRSGSILNAVSLATNLSGNFRHPHFTDSGSSDRESLSERERDSDPERSRSHSVIDSYVDTAYEDSLSVPSSISSSRSYPSSSPRHDSMATFLPASITSSTQKLAHLHLSGGSAAFHFQRCTDGSYRLKTASHDYIVPRAGKLELEKDKPEKGDFYLVFH